MLKALQIQELVKGGEGYNVDFKRSVPSKVKEISDEVASFANAAGGYVLIGVDNNNQIIGAEIDNNKRSAIQDTIGEISPALRCEFYPVDVEGKQVWVIDVPSGKDKPYITGGVIYVREGANCQKLRSAEEIRAFLAIPSSVKSSRLSNSLLRGNVSERFAISIKVCKLRGSISLSILNHRQGMAS